MLGMLRAPRRRVQRVMLSAVTPSHGTAVVGAMPTGLMAPLDVRDLAHSAAAREMLLNTT